MNAPVRLGQCATAGFSAACRWAGSLFLPSLLSLAVAVAFGSAAVAAVAAPPAYGYDLGSTSRSSLANEQYDLAATAMTSPASVATATAGGEPTSTGASAWAVVVFRGFSAAEELPTVEFSRSRVPNIAANIETAQAEGAPSILTRETDQGAIDANRAAATKGFSGPGSPDEYPSASTQEGGAGARVTGVPLSEQVSQGGTLSRFYLNNGIGQGDQFGVRVVP